MATTRDGTRANGVAGTSSALHQHAHANGQRRPSSSGSETSPSDTVAPTSSLPTDSDAPSTDANVPAGAHDGDSSRPSAQRRASTPLMPAFMVSAPGKVIVYGEHAVVHGKAAIAAAISLRSYLLVTFLSKSRRTVSLRFPDISLDHTWTIDSLPWSAFSAPSKKKNYYDLVTSLDPDLLSALEPHIANISSEAPENVRKIHRASATAFLYLFLSLGSQKSPACVYTLRSTLPIGAGLGSSASIAVCLSCALLLQIRALSGPHPDQPAQESETQVERINRWAFVAELCIHGNPSGVDNTVAAGGKAVLFKREDYARPPTVRRLNRFPELPLLLVNTRQGRSTAAEVAKVGRLRKRHPEVAERILEAIDRVTEEAHELIGGEAGCDGRDPKVLERLGELVRINHGLLVGLGVSHPKLERVRELVDHAGIGYTKLTGAGGGGCAISILKPESEIEGARDGGGRDGNGSGDDALEKGTANGTGSDKASILRDLEKRLEAEGFEKFETTLAGDGVGVLWPAVLQNGSGEAGGEEIDQEKFLRAQGNEGIERLVGVAAGRQGKEVDGVDGDVREGWRFWRV